MRKLATIRKITNIVPIENCDNIALGIVDGWTVIIKKSEFSIGDSCVFFEIDSFLPLEPRYEFLKKTTKFDGKEGYRIKTMKMKGVLSQGLALPLSMFPEVSTNDDDVTNRLNVIKFDLEQFYGANTAGPRERKYGSFPTFIPKTDQPRIQNMTHMFLTHKATTFEETLKLDGSSMTCYKIPNKPTLFQRVLSFFGKQLPIYKFGVCSRNVDLKPSDNKVQIFDNFGKKSVYAQSDFWATAIKMDIENKLPIGYAIQG